VHDRGRSGLVVQETCLWDVEARHLDLECKYPFSSMTVWRCEEKEVLQIVGLTDAHLEKAR
jgi:hypothetical protein